MLEVGTHPVPRSSWRTSTARSSGGTAATGGRSSAHSIPAAHRWASAARQGRRMAASPPGSGTCAEVPDPVEAVVPGDEDLSTPDGAVGPEAGPVERDPDDALGPRATPCSAMTDAMWAWWCCTSATGPAEDSSAQRRVW